MVPCAGPVFEELHTFLRVFISLGAKPRCNSSKSSSTMVKSNRLVGGRLLPLLRERLVEELAILRRLTACTFSVWASTKNEHRCQLIMKVFVYVPSDNQVLRGSKRC